MDELLTFDGAVNTTIASARPMVATPLPLSQAIGRVLASDVVSLQDVPPFHRAMMDGYAVRGAEAGAGAGATFELIGLAVAGQPYAGTVSTGEAIRIMTGAKLPDGADTVIRQEWCHAARTTVQLTRTVQSGESVQPAGDDVRANAPILQRGVQLTPLDVALGLGCGVASVSVAQPPVVALFVTGDELVTDPITPLAPGQIYSSNGAMLAGLLADDGVTAHIVHLPDDPAQLNQVLSEAILEADYVVVTGGVSKGEMDFVPSVVEGLCERQQGHLRIRQVWMRPGSPFIHATFESAVLFGLSGNPAACFIQFETLVRPVIRRSLGLKAPLFAHTGRLAHAVNLKRLKQTRILRARGDIRDGCVTVDVQLGQSAGVLSSFGAANCLLRLDEHVLPEGTVVPIHWIRSF